MPVLVTYEMIRVADYIEFSVQSTSFKESIDISTVNVIEIDELMVL